MESLCETWADSEEKVKKVFMEKLQLQREIEVKRIQRTWTHRGEVSPFQGQVSCPAEGQKPQRDQNLHK